MRTFWSSRKAMVLGLVVAGALAQALAAEAAQDRVRVYYREGSSLSVQVIPDGSPGLQFRNEGGDRWVMTGNTRALVGKSYILRLENNGRQRIKVVVGVDGVNAFFRKRIEGYARADVGAVLGSREVRVIKGFQVDEEEAQRFLFSPPEFSEGQDVRGARVGEIEVHIYEEMRPEKDIFLQKGDVPQPRAEGGPPIGTTTGDDVDSQIRRVRFVSATPEPAARVLLAYGRPEREIEREDVRPSGVLGVVVESHPRGCRVQSVEEDSIAEDVGLRRGDIIIKADSEDEPSPQMLRRLLRGKGEGNYLFLEVERGRHLLTFKVRL
jgi:hypothetical protein